MLFDRRKLTFADGISIQYQKCGHQQGNHMPKHTVNSADYVNWFTQLPGMIIIMDINSNFITSNNYTANLLGYSRHEALVGLNAFEVRCPAAESADEFIKQDQYVLKNESEISLLDIHTYADNQAKIFLTKKKPFYMNGKISGVICHCTEIHSDTFSNLCATLIQTDKKYLDSSHSNQRSYMIGSTENVTKLSKRELDVLFYYLRGKTAKTIAKALDLSYRTVENYIQNIKNKIKINTKEDLIEYCIQQGYFSYIPETVLTQNISILL